MGGGGEIFIFSCCPTSYHLVITSYPPPYRYPHTYRNKLTGKRIIGTVICIWLISLALPCVYFEVGFITYAFIFANTSVVVASAITCFIYAVMVNAIRKRSNEDRADSSAMSSDNGSEMVSSKKSGGSKTTSGKQDQNTARLERTFTKMFLVVMAAVLGCYGPSTILIYCMSFCDSCSCVALHWCRDLQFLLVVLNSSLNFFCYAIRSSRFRKAFTYILKFQRPICMQ